ncbi:MAG: HD domain-containing protein [Candidatus Thermoplasmatota archaeon]
MAKQRVSQLKEGEMVNSYFSVKFKKAPKEYRYGLMFEMRLADLSGEITAKYWGDMDRGAMDALHSTISKGGVVRVIGDARTFGDHLEIAIGKSQGGALKALGPGEYDYRELVGASPRDPEEMLSELREMMKGVEDPHLTALLRSFFEDVGWVERFKHAPASMMLHSNYIGGLLEHTLNVTKICAYSAQLYPGVDRDLAITGAVLHDIGKMKEMEITSNIDITEEGMLRGHTVLGEEEVNKRIAEIEGFPERLRMKLDNIVLSHMGEKDWGAARKPQIPEAVLVHLADLIDAQVFQYLRAREEADTEDLWVWNKRLGHVYLG